MSAIAGVINLDGQGVEPALIESMIDVLAHRGSDRRGLWMDGNVALAHRDFWTTPEGSLESLPMEAHRVVITGDVRLDNRRDLLNLLSDYTCNLFAAPDSAIVLAAYERWGEGCVDHFLGDFAFAIWDAKARKLFCARDKIGVKPFYYAFLPRRLFVFGSEIKAVLAVADIPDTINEQKVADAFVHLIDDPTATYYEKVLRLSAAHCLSVTNSVTTRCYWRLNEGRELHLKSDGEYAEGFREHFSRAVKCRLRSNHLVGSMLSGGLDSSSISCVARDFLKTHLQLPLHTFSAVFDEVTECDERNYIQAIIEQGHCSPQFIVLDRVSPLAEAEAILWHLDEPYSSGNLYLSWNAYRRANDVGVRVMLDGFDGDNVVSHGFGRLVELASTGAWWKLAKELRSGSANLNLDSWSACWWQWMSRYHPAARYANRLWSAAARRLQPRSTSVSRELNPVEVLNPDLARRHGFRQLARNRSQCYRNERERHLQQLKSEGIPRTFELLSHAAAAFNVEVRFPFMDIRLIEYCLSLPSDQKMRDGFTRVVMRNGMAGILPEVIRRRGGKSNLAPSFQRGLFKFERKTLRPIILNESKVADYLDMKTIKECLHRFETEQATAQETNFIWNTASLAIWLRSRRAKVKHSIMQRQEVN